MRTRLLSLVVVVVLAGADLSDAHEGELVEPDRVWTDERPTLLGGRAPDRKMLAWFAHLVKRQFFGHRRTEAAAFIILDEEGELQCRMWPATNGYRAQRFRGRIPAGAVAIVHTHPRGSSPLPSVEDREQALRSRLPIFVATPRNVTVARNDGTIESVFQSEPWMHRREPEPCS